MYVCTSIYMYVYMCTRVYKYISTQSRGEIYIHTHVFPELYFTLRKFYPEVVVLGTPFFFLGLNSVSKDRNLGTESRGGQCNSSVLGARG